MSCFNSFLQTHRQVLLLFSGPSGNLSRMPPFYPTKLTSSLLLTLLIAPLFHTQHSPISLIPLKAERCFRPFSWVLSLDSLSCSLPHFSTQPQPSREVQTAWTWWWRWSDYSEHWLQGWPAWSAKCLLHHSPHHSIKEKDLLRKAKNKVAPQWHMSLV